MTRTINFLDLETTGGNDPEHRIIEHCSMLFDLDTQKHLQTFTWRIHPGRKIEAAAQKVHGISLADLEGKPPIEQVAPLIRGTIDPAYLCVAHNGDEFDFDFLGRELTRVGFRPTFQRTFDTMKAARWATHNGKNPRLGELARCLDVDYDPSQAHSAEYDVSVMAQCFFEGVRLGAFQIP